MEPESDIGKGSEEVSNKDNIEDLININSEDCGRAVQGRAMCKRAEIMVQWRVSQVDRLGTVLFIA